MACTHFPASEMQHERRPPRGPAALKAARDAVEPQAERVLQRRERRRIALDAAARFRARKQAHLDGDAPRGVDGADDLAEGSAREGRRVGPQR